VPLDLADIDRFADAGLLIKVAHVTREILILVNVPPIALEVRVVDRVEADQGAEQPPVGFGDRAAGQITLLR
jgi:hypothetical protein